MDNRTILTQMKAIRAKCLDCSGYQTKEVDECPHTACTLYPYRFGKSPKGFKKVACVAPFLKRLQEGGDGIVIPNNVRAGMSNDENSPIKEVVA